MNKTIVIFGAGEGISFELAKIFVQNNFNVTLISRNIFKLEKIKETLIQINNNVKIFSCDISDEKQLNQTIDTILEENNEIDAVLYNAAHIKQGNILDESFKTIVDDFKINVASLVTIVQRFRPALSRSTGALLITGGGIGIKPNPDYVSLSLGKAALRNLTQSINKTLSGENVFVSTILINSYVSTEKKLHNPKNIADIFWNLYRDRSVSEVLL